MKIKIIFFSCFLIFIVLNCQAQDYTLSWGKESIAKNGMFPNKIIGEYDGGLYILKDKWSSKGINHYITLEKYASNDLHLVYAKELDMPDNEDGKGTKFANIFLLKGKLVLITESLKAKSSLDINKRGTIYKCYITPINDEGIVEKKAKEIFVDDQHIDYFNAKTCGFILSKDSTQLFIYGGRIIDGKIKTKTINSDLTTATENDIDLNFKGAYTLTNLKLEKNNTLYCIATEELPPSEWFSKSMKKYSSKIMAFDLKNSTSKSKLIPVKINKPLSPFSLEIQNNNIYVVSYYYDAVKHKATSGGLVYCQFNLDNLDLLNSVEKEFDNIVLSQLSSNITLPGMNTNIHDDSSNYINSLSQPKIKILENGDNLIISEQRVFLYGATNHGLNYFNLLVTRVNKDGKFVHNTVIPKIQGGLTPSIYSFESFYKNNTLYLIFIDNPKNLDLKDSYKLEGGIASIKGTVPVIVSVSENGEWHKKLLFKDAGLPNIYPTTSLLRKGNQLLIFGQKGKNIKFATINY